MKFHASASESRYSDTGAYELRPLLDDRRVRRGWSVWHGHRPLGEAKTFKAAAAVAERHSGTMCQRLVGHGRHGRVHRCGIETAIGDRCRYCVNTRLVHDVLTGLTDFVRFAKGEG